MATAKKQEPIRFFPDSQSGRRKKDDFASTKSAVKLIHAALEEGAEPRPDTQKVNSKMVCTFETSAEFDDFYNSLNKTADRNGRFESEKEALAAAKAAGYELNNIAIVFFLE